MQSDIGMAVQWSKKLETLLEDRFGATGKGLHEKINSVQTQLPIVTSRKLRFVATIRNKIVHETTYSRIEDRGRFERTCSDLVSALNGAGSSHRKKCDHPDKAPGNDSYGAFPTIGSAARSSSRFASLSSWLSLVGGIAGFAIPTIHGERVTLALISAMVGAVAGFFGKPF